MHVSFPGGMQYKPCTKKDLRNNTERPKELAGCLGSPLMGDICWNCYHKPHLKAKVCIANGHTTREEKLVETERDVMQWIVQMGIRVLLQSETSTFFKEHWRPVEYLRQWKGLRARITSPGGCLGVWLRHASDRPPWAALCPMSLEKTLQCPGEGRVCKDGRLN